MHLAWRQHVAHSAALLARPLLGAPLCLRGLNCSALDRIALVWVQHPAPELLWHLLLAGPCLAAACLLCLKMTS